MGLNYKDGLRQVRWTANGRRLIDMGDSIWTDRCVRTESGRGHRMTFECIHGSGCETKQKKGAES